MRKELIYLAGPMAIGLISHSLMTMVDTIFVGQLGTEHLAAVGLAGIVSFTILAFGMGMVRATKTLIAQAIGAKRGEKDIGAFAAAGLIWAVGFGILFIGIAQAVAPYVGTLAEEPKVAGYAIAYLQIRSFGYVFDLLWSVLKEIGYGHGDSRAAMRTSIVANFSNIGLDALFIFGFDMGVAGAAWATVLSAMIGMLGMAYAERRRAFHFASVARRHLAAIWEIGLPSGIEFVINVGAFLMLSIILVRISPEDMAAHQIAIQILHFIFLPVHAVAEATTVLAGNMVGERRLRNIFKVTRVAIELALGYTLICILILIAFAENITSWFSDDAQVTTSAEALLWVSFGFLFIDGIQMVVRGALRGTGDVRWPAMVGILAAWIFTPPLTYFLGMMLGMGAVGAWLGLTIEVYALAGLLTWRLISLTWGGPARRARRLQRAHA